MSLIPIPWEGHGKDPEKASAEAKKRTPSEPSDLDTQLKADLKKFIERNAKSKSKSSKLKPALWQIMALISRGESMSKKELEAAELSMQDLIVYLQRLKKQ